MTAMMLTPPRELVAGATPTSEGAHRLAWWLAADDRRFALLASNAGIALPLIDRLLDGTMVPVGDRACAIARESEGEVLPLDWERPCLVAWTDRPVTRPTATPPHPCHR